MRQLLYLWLPLIALLCIAADNVEDALQAGYRAFLNQQYEAAIAKYEQAMTQSPDPGRIACDLGCILAQAGRYTEAAQAFTRSMEDAQGLRRIRAAYGQATALTHIAVRMQGKRAVAVLQRALQSYELVLRECSSLTSEEAGTWPSVKADTEHNRSIATALLTQKQKEPDPPNTEDDPLKNDPLLSQIIDPGGNGGAGRNAVPLTGRNSASSGTESGTSDSAAGRGNLPPLPDDGQAPPISLDEANRRLDQLLQRLRKPAQPTPVKPGTRDW